MKLNDEVEMNLKKGKKSLLRADFEKLAENVYCRLF